MPTDLSQTTAHRVLTPLRMAPFQRVLKLLIALDSSYRQRHAFDRVLADPRMARDIGLPPNASDALLRHDHLIGWLR